MAFPKEVEGIESVIPGSVRGRSKQDVFTVSIRDNGQINFSQGFDRIIGKSSPTTLIDGEEASSGQDPIGKFRFLECRWSESKLYISFESRSSDKRLEMTSAYPKNVLGIVGILAQLGLEPPSRGERYVFMTERTRHARQHEMVVGDREETFPVSLEVNEEEKWCSLDWAKKARVQVTRRREERKQE